jgi:hypothetical protein
MRSAIDPTQAWRRSEGDMSYRGTSAGGGFSTVGDFLKFATALMSNKLLDAAHTQTLLTGKVDTGRQGLKYAYGFEDGLTIDGIRRVGHGGGAPGMNGRLGIFPASGYVVVGLANIDPPAAERLTSFVSARLPLDAAGKSQSN